MATTNPPPTNEPDCGCGPTVEAPVNSDLPSPQLLASTDNVPLYDKDGGKHTFRSIYASNVDKHLIIFVRHWFCGNCQEYIRTLSHHLPLSSLPPSTKITIIGHGSYELIGNYMAVTGWEGEMYTNTDKELFKALELGSSKAMGEKPKYIKQSLLGTTVAGIMQGLGSGKNALKGGDFWQIGGEFLFVKEAEEWKVTWAHRMKNTRDHAEVDELLKVLGVEGTQTKERSARDLKTEIAGFKTWMGGRGKTVNEATKAGTESNVETKEAVPVATNPADVNGTTQSAEKPYKVLVDSDGKEFLPTTSKHGATNAWLK